MLYCCRATNTSGKDNISWHANLNSDLHKKTTNQTVIWSREKLSRQQTVNQAFKLSTSQNTKGIFIWSWGAPSNHTSGIGSKWLLWCNQMKTVNDVQTWERLFFFFSVQCQAQTADQNLLMISLSADEPFKLWRTSFYFVSLLDNLQSVSTTTTATTRSIWIIKSS